MTEKKSFLNNNNGTITDNSNGLAWSQKDSWQIHQDWLTFQEALSWVDELNKKDFLGFHDWRIPEKDEMEKLFIQIVICNDKITQSTFYIHSNNNNKGMFLKNKLAVKAYDNFNSFYFSTIRWRRH